jgi:hypothetical protein
MKKELNKCALAGLIVSSLLIAGCGNGKDAQLLYDRAKALYEDKCYSPARNVIDSINALYPKELKIRREALRLMREIDRGESERNIAFCDSVMPEREKEVERLKKSFVFEKNPEYDESGNYIPPSMIVERNTERSYIRCGVTEEGEMYVASVYFGVLPIKHTGLKLSASNGAYVETPAIPYDGGVNYRFKNNGNTTEVVTYKGNNCKDIANFTYNNMKERIKAEYTGGKPYTIVLSESDKKAFRLTLELSSVLSEINTLKKEKDRSEKRIRMIDEKLK